jgi:chemotaxis protein methyltransferase CheR
VTVTGTTRGSASEGSTAAAPHGRYALATREFEHLRRLIYAEAGISLSPAKRVLLESRLSKRLRALGLDSFEEYCAYLDERRDDELVAFINCVTTNKTDFFREPHHFEFLREHVLPAVDARARQTGERRLRVWSAGCSTGEEPYTIAMIVREWLKGRPGWDVRILASDIDTHVLATAAAGEYDADRLSDVPLESRERWFPLAAGGRDGLGGVGRRHADQSLRDLIAFRRINLNDEPWPIQSAFDVIFCRNVIIYFDRDTQSRLLTRFARLLRAEGHLIIGHSESLAWLSDTFASVRGVPTVYKLAARAAGKAPLPKPLSQGEGLSSFSESPRDPVCSGEAIPSDAVRPRFGQTSRPATPTAAARPPSTPSSFATPSASRQVSVLSEQAATVPGTRHRVPRGLAQKGSPLSLGEGDGGEGLFAPRAAEPFRAIVGAQVLVGLFDADAAVGGAAIVSSDANASSLLTSLLRQLEARGARTERLRAKVFGGAALPNADAADAAAAARTVDAVREALASLNVPIAAARTGGHASLEIIFHPDTGRALVRETRGDAR